MRELTCPVIREATSEDAPAIARLILNSGSEFIYNVFVGKKAEAIAFYTQHYSQYPEGLYVLVEGTVIVGAMKILVPDRKIGRTFSIYQLIKHLGLRRGIRAGVLLAPWDEYRLKKDESYLEFLIVDSAWQESPVEMQLLNYALNLGLISSCKFMSMFLPLHNPRISLLESRGFFEHRQVSVFLSKLFGGIHLWSKQVIPLVDTPITLKGMVKEKVNLARDMWVRNSEKAIFGIRTAMALIMVPIIAGTFAYFRGFQYASIWWLLVFGSHFIGIVLIFDKRHIGFLFLSAAVVSESLNLILRSILTSSWIDKSWLVPTALGNMWVAFVLIQARHNHWIKQEAISDAPAVDTPSS